MILDGGKLVLCDITVYHIGCRAADDRLLVFVQKLHTLLCGICSLVELARQKFYRKCVGCEFWLALTQIIRNLLLSVILVDVVYRRLGKYGLKRFLVCILRHILHIVADQNAHLLHPDSKVMLDLMAKLICLYRKIRLLFYIYTTYIAHFCILLYMVTSFLCL